MHKDTLVQGYTQHRDSAKVIFFALRELGHARDTLGMPGECWHPEWLVGEDTGKPPAASSSFQHVSLQEERTLGREQERWVVEKRHCGAG